MGRDGGGSAWIYGATLQDHTTDQSMHPEVANLNNYNGMRINLFVSKLVIKVSK